MILRKCCLCKIDKDVSEYNKHPTRKDGLQSACKECNRKKGKDWYENNKSKHRANVKNKKENDKVKMYEYLLDKKCLHCNENDPIVLEFDHINKEDKLMEVNTMVLSGFTWDKILNEISKCQILCCNCHRRKTAKQEGYYKYLLSNK